MAVKIPVAGTVAILAAWPRWVGTIVLTVQSLLRSRNAGTGLESGARKRQESLKTEIENQISAFKCLVPEDHGPHGK
jgi:hypothetical protein